MGFDNKYIERDHDRKGMSEMTQGITQLVISDKIRASKAFFTTPLYRFIIMSGVHYFAICLISKIAGLLAWQIPPPLGMLVSHHCSVVQVPLMLV